MKSAVSIIGGGLAGCEAAWQLLQRGHAVQLFEMKPQRFSPAHKMEYLAELVCSNSLKSNHADSAPGMLKQELRTLDSLIMSAADQTAVAAGSALAVDRTEFARTVQDKLLQQKNFKLIRQEVTEIPRDIITIIATGPLTSDRFARAVSEMLGGSYLYFYDAAAPIVTYESINKDKVFMASRYDKGDSDYINCPMSEEEYVNFHRELVNAETAPLKSFEKEVVFEGCMPVETMAKRGLQTLLFGPLKPVGLTDPRSGKQPYAVVQLRQDNKEGTLYNIVGFQTHLKWGEQKRVFGMIPGLENAEFVRYGVMHRNTFIYSPKVMRPTLQFHNNDKLFFAGQMTGVEGYVESASSGLVAGINMARIINGMEPVVFPETTAHGALCRYITDRTIKAFQPMNVNFGIFPQPEYRIRNKKEKSSYYAERALKDLEKFIQEQL